MKLYAGIGNGLRPEKDNTVVVIAVPKAIAVIRGQVNVTIRGSQMASPFSFLIS
ncbi:MAG TPA: hypothetical protein VE288_09615 [Rubrobacteraceae bacterium]|nr:hypothetical protein [Rubrobacteraceae bacterium]